MNPFKRYGEAKSELRRVQMYTLAYRITQEALDHVARGITVKDLRKFRDASMRHNHHHTRWFIIPGFGFAYEIADMDEV